MARALAGWALSLVLILLIASFPREISFADSVTHPTSDFSWAVYTSNLFQALKAPVAVFTEHNLNPRLASNQERIVSYVPLSLFYVTFAFVGSYLVGILKGIADVFWSKKRGYRAVQGVAWILDAIPLFGLVTLLELGTLYAFMYVKGDPIGMIPNQSFVGGDIIPAIILMWAPMMYVARLLAISIRQELGEQYVLTARSKGLSLKTVFMGHVLRNCIPKLLNEANSVFTLILSSLLLLEFLSYRWGAAFDMYVAMGHGKLGSPSVYDGAGPTPFNLSLVVDYLLMFALLTLLFRGIGMLLSRKWRVIYHA